MARNHKRKKPTHSQSAVVPRRAAHAESNEAQMRTDTSQQTELRFEQETYTGPVMHPRIATAWEEVLRGSADCILKMAEGQARHRQWIEKVAVSARSFSAPLGALFGTALGALGMYFGYNLLMADKSIAGSAYCFPASDHSFGHTVVRRPRRQRNNR